MSRYRVTERTQLNHDGKLYAPGETVDLDDDQAAPLLASGTVDKVGRAKAVEPDQLENKAATKRRR